MSWYEFPNEVQSAPHQEGVYLLSTRADSTGIVYVGRADDIQGRLQQHPDPENPCLQRTEISHFAYIVTDNSEGMEQDLIGRYDPDCNRT